MTILLQLGLAAAIVLGAMTVFQDHLLYFPSRADAARMQQGGLRAWPSVAEFRALLAEPPGAAARGTAIVFHGNAGHAGHRDYYVPVLTGLGLRVMLAEYPGYGPRDGELGERSLVDDADQTIAMAHRELGAPLIVIGESLGAGVAAAAAARHPDRIAGLLLITPWDRLQHVAKHHYPWLPVGWLLRDQYDSAAHLAAFAPRVLVVVAERDTIVPARFGVALHAALTGPKRLETIATAGHNDWIGHVNATWWRRAVDYLLGDGG